MEHKKDLFTEYKKDHSHSKSSIMGSFFVSNVKQNIKMNNMGSEEKEPINKIIKKLMQTLSNTSELKKNNNKISETIKVFKDEILHYLILIITNAKDHNENNIWAIVELLYKFRYSLPEHIENDNDKYLHFLLDLDADIDVFKEEGLKLTNNNKERKYKETLANIYSGLFRPVD